MRNLIIGVILAGCAGLVQAADVVRWVDDNGQVHFGDAQLAPPSATRVHIGRANPMDVAVPVAGSAKRSGKGFVKISRAGKRNKDGWRGHSHGRKGGRADGGRR